MSLTRMQVRKLRREATPAERVLWEQLRDRKLQGLKFSRQHPIGPFIADFCCRDRRIVVEVDGEIHLDDQQKARDGERDAYLKGLNYVVLRFSNQDVLENPEAVLKKIATEIWRTPMPWNR